MTRWTAEEDAMLRTMWAGDDLLVESFGAFFLGREDHLGYSRIRPLAASRPTSTRRGSPSVRALLATACAERSRRLPITRLQLHRNGTFDSRAALHRLWEAWCA